MEIDLDNEDLLKPIRPEGYGNEMDRSAGKIFVITHKPFVPPADPMYVPLQVGRANAGDLGFLGDDSGDSISSLNPYFCELTGMYWLWKNYRAPGFIGICHYRRYLINEQGNIFAESELKALLSGWDMVATKLLALPCTYFDGFGENHHQKDLVVTGEVIREKYPAYGETFDRLVHGNRTYFGNIFVTSKEIYDRYCSWLFDILFEVQRRTDFTGYNEYQKRLFGFLAEFLQTVWIRFHGLRVCECKVGMSGGKYETERLTAKLAGYFGRRDYIGAGKYFLECYRKRPDLLMEASDVTGELRLCMQIISTCSFEDEAYGWCILDALRDYGDLIRHFHRLNETVSDFLADGSTGERVIFPADGFSRRGKDCPEGSSLVTPVAIEISVKMFCKDASRQKTAARELCRRISQMGEGLRPCAVKGLPGLKA